ncbi:MAG: membrane protein insertase YidC [Treponema sp.]|jgi:YidC/Oxa1 family membrane protein insertase|nr:membrane protein insertase YidC [Treponema sp.]
MEKNTILAIVLSTLVLIFSFMMQGLCYEPVANQVTEQQTQTPVNEQFQEFFVPDHQEPVSEQTDIDMTQLMIQRGLISVAEAGEYIPLHPPIVIETDLKRVVLSNVGGEITSLQWIDQRKRDAGSGNYYVDLILPGNNPEHPAFPARAFTIAFGDQETRPVSSHFRVNYQPELNPYIVEFSRDYIIPSGVTGTEHRFKLTKRYEFKQRDLMFELTILLDGSNFSVIPFNFAGNNAYTLSFGPQMGPPFERLDRFHDYRFYQIFSNGRRRDVRVDDHIVEPRPPWAAISGKYFVFIAYLARIQAPYSLRYSEKEEEGLSNASRLHVHRPSITSHEVIDRYYFYLGPRTQDILSRYNIADRNEFGLRDANLSEVASTRGFFSIFSPLERLLKWLLMGIYSIVGNYGIAIILLTLLIKIAFFPLTKKGSMATLRMQALSPKIKELQEKYKNNKPKLQMEMAAFYKQEGYNPLAGCLPMLLQLPIFITMYQLFNNHFELRGAVFIPGWIPDLSLPEHIVQFPPGFTLPILGWTALRALPFIYVASQLLYGKVTQMPGQQSAGQMKIMLFVLPIVFFFVLYDVPSGLLIYWVFSNLLTLVQQVIINKYIIKKRTVGVTASSSSPASSDSANGKKKKKKR